MRGVADDGVVLPLRAQHVVAAVFGDQFDGCLVEARGDLAIVAGKIGRSSRDARHQFGTVEALWPMQFGCGQGDAAAKSNDQHLGWVGVQD